MAKNDADQQKCPDVWSGRLDNSFLYDWHVNADQKVFITLTDFVAMQNRYRQLAENVSTSGNADNRERNLMLMRGYEMALDDMGLPFMKIRVSPFVPKPQPESQPQPIGSTE